MESNKIIGYTTGVFDLFHIGHLNLIRKAKKHCDYLIVGVTTDKLAFQRKQHLPVIQYTERIKILRAIRYVDKVVPQNNMNKMLAWNKYHFDRIFVGDDWKGTPSWIQYEKQFSKIGVSIKYFPYTKTTSSSLIKQILLEKISQK